MRGLFLLIPVVAFTQAPLDRTTLAPLLRFERSTPGNAPTGWGGGPPGTLFIDDEIQHAGNRSLRLDRSAPNSTSPFSTATLSIPIDFDGTTLELRGFLRTENVTDFAGLWMREDGNTPSLAFDNMNSQKLKGTTGWQQYSIRLPLHPDAKTLYLGVLMAGSGRTWAADLQLLVDGKPVGDVPKTVRAQTVLDTDREFDLGSRVTLSELKPNQVENLVTLGKVWGFLKYHHPRVVQGKIHWDYELFRILPKVIAAPDRAQANAALQTWIAGLGAIPACNPCISLDETDLHLRPSLDWLDDESQLGRELSRTLRGIHRNRSSSSQFYVGRAGASNPSFDHELAYRNIRFPDSGYQLLALFRFWNIIEYWFPDRDVIGEDWTGVLRRFLAPLALAKTRDEYQLQMMALIAAVHDSHANLWSSLSVRPPTGECRVPVTVRFIGGKAVVAGYSDAKAGPESGLKPGDVIAARDGVPVPALIERWSPYYAASNDASQLREIGRSLLQAPCGQKVSLRREGDTHDLTLPAISVQYATLAASLSRDLPGETFQRLSPSVAYLKLSSVKTEDVRSYIDRAAGTQGLIIDIRNYPSAFMPFALGSHLVDRPTPFVRFTTADLANPGAFRWRQSLVIQPAEPRYSGKIVILVNETTQSQAEYTAMALRTAPRAIVIGSTTAGADGNVSDIPLPGGLNSMISGIGVFYPNKRPTQRIGIVPDIEVHQTIAGVRDGRDELMEAALRQILGYDIPLSDLQKLIPR